MSWYDPKDASSAIDEGWYNAILESVEMSKTKKGADMQVVTFRVYGSREITVKEFFHAASMWKYKKLALALGKGAEFTAGQFDAKDFLRKSVDLELNIEDSPEYGEQNRIAGFALDGSQATDRPTTASPGGGTPIDASDIPF